MVMNWWKIVVWEFQLKLFSPHFFLELFCPEISWFACQIWLWEDGSFWYMTSNYKFFNQLDVLIILLVVSPNWSSFWQKSCHSKVGTINNSARTTAKGSDLCLLLLDSSTKLLLFHKLQCTIHLQIKGEQMGYQILLDLQIATSEKILWIIWIPTNLCFFCNLCHL